MQEIFKMNPAAHPQMQLLWNVIRTLERIQSQKESEA